MADRSSVLITHDTYFYGHLCKWVEARSRIPTPRARSVSAEAKVDPDGPGMFRYIKLDRDE